MNYYTSKYTQTIPKKTLIDYPDICNSTQYTHVVTSVTYGLQVVMDFHKKTRDDDFEGKISGSMGWILNMIPGLATGSSHMSEEDRVVADECSITIFGDFSPEDVPPPANLNQAVEFYRNLPSMTGTKENHWKGTTIQEFHATPISDICADLNPTLNELNESLMKASESMLDDLDRLRMRVGSLLDSVVAIRFSPLQKNLQIYQKALKDFTSSQKRKLKEIVPRIRGGNAEAEEDLNMLLTDYLNSVFQIDKSLEFLINRGRELNAIRFLIESFPPASNRLIQDYSNVEEAQVMFLRDKVVLLELGVLSDENVTKSFLDGEPVDENDFWYNKQNTSGAVGSTVRNFFDFADTNVGSQDKGYVIKLNLVSKDDPTRLTAYDLGTPVPEPFEIPLVADDLKPFNITVNGFKITVPKANQFVDSFRYTLTDLTTTAQIEKEERFEESIEFITVGVITCTNSALSFLVALLIWPFLIIAKELSWSSAIYLIPLPFHTKWYKFYYEWKLFKNYSSKDRNKNEEEYENKKKVCLKESADHENIVILSLAVESSVEASFQFFFQTVFSFPTVILSLSDAPVYSEWTDLFNWKIFSILSSFGTIAYTFYAIRYYVKLDFFYFYS